MSPVCLLFSPEGETSRQVAQALRELELKVEACPDIFTAAEWLSARSFDVIVADGDVGPEAAFLLKNSREMKLNRAAFTVAIGGHAHGDVDSPDLLLTKPLSPDPIKYAFLTNDRFLGCMKTWIARGDFQSASDAVLPVVTNEPGMAKRSQPSPPVRHLPGQPSPKSTGPNTVANAPLHLTFATLDRKLFRSLNAVGGKKQFGSFGKRRVWLGRTAVLGAALISAGYIFAEPLHVKRVFAAVATVYNEVVEAKFIRHPSPNHEPSAVASLHAQPTTLIVVPRRLPNARVQSVPLHESVVPDQIPPLAEDTPQPVVAQSQNQLASVRPVDIPESLHAQPRRGAVRDLSVISAPPLLSQLEPMNLPESAAQQLLVAKVLPTYPQQALRAGIQGIVVLQAWIARDGSIRDLKLINGPLLLGQAAVQAVRQWRYKPYVRNGVAVETQTYVTVDFKLP